MLTVVEMTFYSLLYNETTNVSHMSIFFLKEIIGLHGLPTLFVSDIDVNILSYFWRDLEFLEPSSNSHLLFILPLMVKLKLLIVVGETQISNWAKTLELRFSVTNC